MYALQQCHAREPARNSHLVVFALTFACAMVRAGQESSSWAECDTAAVLAHVRDQFHIYGPRSDKLEYFGFIYRVDGVVASAVVHGQVCHGHDDCMVDIRPAARSIPKGAKVLGEWHTHPHFLAAGRLSIEDVRGARKNARIRCYTPYYAGSNGTYYSWDPLSSSVPVAMGTRTELGSYRDETRSAREPIRFAAGK